MVGSQSIEKWFSHGEVSRTDAEKESEANDPSEHGQGA